MVYTPTIPQTNDDPTESQPLLLGNFGKLNSDWLVNHIPLTAGGNSGFHKMVQFPTPLGSDPSVTGPLESVVYPKVDGNGNVALFFKNSIGTYQLTDLSNNASGSNYGIVTPFGITINAGLVASGITSVTYRVPVSSLITAVICPASALTTFRLTASDNTHISWSTTTPSSFYYLVIGVS